MKTILHISKYYYPDLGGIETVALYLAEGLKEYNNIVVCFATNGLYSEDNINGVTIYRVPVNFSFMSQDVAFSYRSILRKVVMQSMCTVLTLLYIQLCALVLTRTQN